MKTLQHELETEKSLREALTPKHPLGSIENLRDRVESTMQEIEREEAEKNPDASYIKKMTAFLEFNKNLLREKENEKLASGGRLDAIYRTGTAKQLWEAWDEKQRDHFIADHTNGNIKYAEDYKKDFENLADEIKKQLRLHLAMGIYAGGGSMATGGEVEIEQGDRVIITTKKFGKEYEGMTGEITPRRLLNDKYAIKLENGMELAFEKGEFRHNSINPKYDNGGPIKNQYENKTAEEVWTAWTNKQKHQFLLDHRNDFGLTISKKGMDMWEEYSMTKAESSSFKELPIGIQDELSVHIYNGQYAGGGKIKSIEESTALLPEVIADIVSETIILEKYKSQADKWKELNIQERKELELKIKTERQKWVDYLTKRAEYIFANNEDFRKKVKASGTKGRDYLYLMMYHWMGVQDHRVMTGGTGKTDYAGAEQSMNRWIESVEKKSSGSMATGGEVGDRMYNFLKDDLIKLEKAIEENDKEETDRFFSYWGYHLKSLAPKKGSVVRMYNSPKDVFIKEPADRMYNFFKDDLIKLEKAIQENDKEETDRFFSYWNIHLKSLKYSSGGSMATGGKILYKDFADTIKTNRTSDDEIEIKELYRKFKNYKGNFGNESEKFEYFLEKELPIKYASKGGSMATGGKIKSIEESTSLLPEVIADTVSDKVIFEKYKSQSDKWKELNKEERSDLESKIKADREKWVNYLTKRAEYVFANNEDFRKKVKASGNKGRDYLYLMMNHWMGVQDSRVMTGGTGKTDYAGAELSMNRWLQSIEKKSEGGRLSPSKQKLVKKIIELKSAMAGVKDPGARKSMQKKIDDLQAKVDYNPTAKERAEKNKGKFAMDVPTKLSKSIYKKLWSMKILPRLHKLNGITSIVVDTQNNLDKAYKVYADVAGEKVPPLSKISRKLV